MKTVKIAKRHLLAIFLGTMLEWYDFTLFGFLAPIISTKFFPSTDKFAALLSAYSVFALGFFIRPLGASILGRYADKHGRKRVLIFCMQAMSLATFLMALLPSYQSIGLLSPILLILLRLLQGFCVGGETTGAISYALELYPLRNRGFIAALSWSAVGMGMLLSSLSMSLLNIFMSHQAIDDWAWRLPLMFGLCTAFIGGYLRLKLPESSLFKKPSPDAQQPRSLFQTLRSHHKALSLVMGLYLLSALITYLIFIFMPAFANASLGIPAQTANIVTSIALSCVTFMMPLSGYLSDTIGRKTCLYLGASGFAFLSFPLYLFMLADSSVHHFVIAEIGFVLFAILYQGVLSATAQEILPTSARFQIAAMGYNFSYALFGGTAPLVVTYLSQHFNFLATPGVYLSLGGFIALACIRCIPETAYQALK